MVARTADSSGSLVTQIAASSGGDTIELTGSNYTALNIDGTTFTSEVVIFGSDSNNKPVFQYQNAFSRFDNTNNVTFKYIVFERLWDSINDGGDQSNTIRINNATNLKIEDCEVKGGNITSGSPIGRGINDGSSGSNVTFTRVKFHNLFKGYTGNTNQLTFDECEFTNLRSDGMSLGDQTDVLIQRCHFHDFNTSPFDSAHPDMIQIYRNNSIGTANLTIRYNVFDDGLGRFGQGLFAGTSGKTNDSAGTPIRHSNWEIHDNVFYKDHDNTLTINWVDGINIYHNTLIQSNAQNSSTECRIRVDDTSTNVTIQDNICSDITTIGSPPPSIPGSWNVSSNSLVTTANIPTNFNIFAATTHTDSAILGNQGFTDSYHDYEIKSGTSAHTNNDGARIGKKEGGWGDSGILPPPTYQGGFIGNGGIISGLIKSISIPGNKPMFVAGKFYYIS